MNETSSDDTHAKKDDRSTFVWIAVGCGSLLLTAMCCVPPVAWLLWSRAEVEEAVAEQESESTPVDPGPAPTPPGPPPAPGSARRVTAVVEQVTGSVPGVRDGGRCEFDVTREERADGTFWCNAQVTCGGTLVYGGATRGNRAGFFDCTLYEQPQRHVVGEDPSTTSDDGDGAMRLDTLSSTLTVRDDASGPHGAFTLRARVTSVR